MEQNLKLYVWQERTGRILAVAHAISLKQAITNLINAGHPDFYFVQGCIQGEEDLVQPVEYTGAVGVSSLCALAY